MQSLLAVTAAVEAGTGIGLLAAPSFIARLLLGVPLDAPAALTVARVAGVALVALGVACGLARGDGQNRAARGVVIAMVIYNVGAVLILGAAGVASPPVGIALWPAVFLHVAMTLWCIASLLRKPAQSTVQKP